jgi:hypothetical protein
MKFPPFFISLLFFVQIGQAQDIDVSKYREQYQLSIKKILQPINLDGELDETDWKLAPSATDFWVKFPTDDTKAKHKTVAKVLYDDKFIYFGITAYDSMPLIGQSLKRDSRIRENDGVGILLDPFGKKTSGFYFSVTAYNVQGDDVLSANNENLSFSWDNKWYSEVKRYPDHYNVEIAIPFKSLRYDQESKNWGINFIRSDRKANEYHAWTRIPVNFPAVDIGYLGSLIWNEPPPKPGNNISIIPYTTGNLSANKENNTGIKGDFDAGFDAKIALTSSMNLDLTVNPDFSQVEVDRQVTNLSRFNIFFPERRNFFLENSDLFSAYGIPPIRPFYSRRIGLDPDGNPIPIIAGVRITGNVASRTRMGIMSMQTKATVDYAAQNYSAFTVQQQVLRRTTIKGYFFNRQGFFDDKHKLTNAIDEYGRNAGSEISFQNEKGEWQGWLGYHLSMKSGVSTKNSFFNMGSGYFGRSLTSFIDFDNVGTNYYTDIGFVGRIENYDALLDTVIRQGFKQFYNQNTYRILPKAGKIIQHNFQLTNFIVLNPDGSFNERTNTLGYIMSFKNTGSFDFQFSTAQTNLQFYTSFTDGRPLPPGKYLYNQYSSKYATDIRKKFSFANGITIGKYYTGNYFKYTAEVIFRQQPWLTIELNAEYNKLSFPEPYGKRDLLLLAPRVEINFSTKIFWTTFLQYNTQRNNFNINSRLQWRYKPASDFFLVYTDNYFSDPFLKNKNRALVFKLNYWLNL